MKTIIKLMFFVLMLCYFNTTALSLDPKKSLKQYIHETWNTSNGLPQNSVSAIVQSKDGYLWFATQEGVVRYDGAKFTIIDRINTPELGTSNIGNIAYGSDDALWFVGNAAIKFSVLKNGKFTSINQLKGFPNVPVNSGILDSTGNLWLSTNSGLVTTNGEEVTIYTQKNGLPSDTVFNLYADHDKRIWISTADPCLTLYQNGTFTNYPKQPGIVSKFFGTMLEDHEGNLWASTDRGLVKFFEGTYTEYIRKDSTFINAIFEDSRKQLYLGTTKGLEKFENGKFVKISNKDGSPRNTIIKIYEDKEGILWVVPDKKGIQRLNAGVLESYTSSDGLSSDDVRTVFEDKEGSLWIGVYGGGLDRFRDTKFTTISKEDGLSDNLIQTIFEDDAYNLWIGTFNDGLNCFKNGKNTIFTTKDNLASNIMQSVVQDKTGDIWVGTGNGLNRFANGRLIKYTTKDSLVNNTIQSMLVDHTGALWLGSLGGITKFKDGKFKKVYRDNNSIFFTLIETKDGTIYGGGFSKYVTIKDGTCTPYPLPDSMKGSSIFAIYEDPEGGIWMGANGVGLLRLKDDKLSVVTPRNGLFDFNAYCLIPDDYGNLWTDCNKGIYRVALKELNDFRDGKISSVKCVSYGTADGMKINECNGGSSPCAWKLHDGRIAFSTVKGVAIINPAEIKLNMVPPSLIIEQMVVEQKAYDIKVNNVFPAGTEKFQFTFAAISFLGVDKVKYKYKLEPFEQDWVDAGNRREAFYTHVPAGDYTFKVLAANSDGVWNEVGATTSFTLKPFFYESSWFITMCIVGVVGVGPGLYFMRVKQMKNRESMLKRIVQERTADLQIEKENVDKTLMELKDAQHQLVLSEKMASLGQLTAGIAHEIKNPLNFVNNFSSLSNELIIELKEELDKKKDTFDDKTRANVEEIMMSLRQNVTKINEHGKRADSIVRGMLLHSRGKTGERQLTDLNALLAEYTNLAYHGLRAQDSSFNVKIETHFDEAVGKVNIVPQDLSRVFLNIINNACYSANDKKKLAPSGFAPTISVSSKNTGDKFEVRIRDNGSGIPQSVIDKIFNPFFTTKPAGAGTGLGLSMSYDIVTQEHKGEIRVDTKEGEFAEFIITIPKNVA